MIFWSLVNASLSASLYQCSPITLFCIFYHTVKPRAPKNLAIEKAENGNFILSWEKSYCKKSYLSGQPVIYQVKYWRKQHPTEVRDAQSLHLSPSSPGLKGLKTPLESHCINNNVRASQSTVILITHLPQFTLPPGWFTWVSEN